MVGMPRTPPIWQAVVEAHERELMMQRKREASVIKLCDCGRRGSRNEGNCIYCRGQAELPGRPMGVTPAELMARQLRMMEAMSTAVPVHPQRTEIEDAIRAYAKKLLAQRAAVVKDARLWDQARALLTRAGAEPPR